MKFLVMAAVVVLLLTGCDDGRDAAEAETPSSVPAVSPTVEVEEVDLGEICSDLYGALELSRDDIVDYRINFREPNGTASNVRMCQLLPPDDDYYEAAGKAGMFNRFGFDFGIAETVPLANLNALKYDPDDVESLITAEPMDHLTEEYVPCADDPCGYATGYFYFYWFETIVDDVYVAAEIDFITTDVTGELQDEYREQAIADFIASMEVIIAAFEAP